MPYTWEEWSKAFNVPPVTPKKKKQNRAQKEGRRRISMLCLAEALGWIPSDDRDTWLRVGMGLKFELGEALGGELWDEWSAGCEEKFSDEANAAALDSFQREDGELTTGDTILYMARERGWNQALYEMRDLFKRADAPPGARAKEPTGEKSTLLEFPDDISIEEQLAWQENALVAGLLHPGAQAMMFAPTKQGKTFVALDLAWHIAMGRPWHDREVKRAPVLYVALEGVRGFKNRVLAARKVHGSTGQHFARIAVPVSLNTTDAGKKGVEKIVAASRELAERAGQPTGLVVIDTQARATAGDEENSAKDMGVYIEDRLGELTRRTGAAMLTIHHPNKNGTSRGSSNQDPAYDLILIIKDGRLIADKVKDGEEGPVFDFKLEQIELAKDRRGKLLTSCVVRKSEPAKAQASATGGPPPERVGRWARRLHTAFGHQVQSGKASRVEATGEVRVDLRELRQAVVELAIAEGTTWKTAPPL